MAPVSKTTATKVLSAFQQQSKFCQYDSCKGSSVSMTAAKEVLSARQLQRKVCQHAIVTVCQHDNHTRSGPMTTVKVCQCGNCK